MAELDAEAPALPWYESAVNTARSSLIDGVESVADTFAELTSRGEDQEEEDQGDIVTGQTARQPVFISAGGRRDAEHGKADSLCKLGDAYYYGGHSATLAQCNSHGTDDTLTRCR